MPLTKLDDVAALVVIDLQKGLVDIPTAYPMAEVIGRTATLARAFRERGLPVVLVNVTGRAPGRTDQEFRSFAFPPDFAELVPELEQQPSDHLVSKKSWGAFLGTDLDRFLRDRSVTQILLAGVATSVGVESTARSAYDLGYHVVVVTDAMTDRDAEAHAWSIEKIFPRLGETATSDEILRMMKH